LTVDPGFNPQRIVTVDLNLIGARYGPIEKRRSFVQSLVERMQAVPGVASVGVVNKLPLTGETNNSTLYPAGTILPSADLPIGAVRQVNPEYFSTMGIALRSGRFIERTDRQKQVAVVAASTAQRLWPGENPLGKRFSIGDPTRPPFEVIGVAPDVQTISLTQKAPATVYVPYWQQLSFTISLVAKTEQEPKSLAPSIRAAIRQIDPELPVPAFQTMAGIVADSVAERRFQMNLVILFGAAALLLASLGIYGVVSFSTLQRTNEMGIRLALGARRRHVRGLVIGRSLVPVVAGLAAGTGLALALGRFLKSLLFGISASDPLTIGGAAAALALVAFGAASIPAQRLTRVDPAVALRHE
jgi:putative ABC transport system permease protein